MVKKNKISKARKEVALKNKGGIPAWLFMTLSFVIPLYGLIYFILLKDKDNKRAKIALFLATIGILFWLLSKVINWLYLS